MRSVVLGIALLMIGMAAHADDLISFNYDGNGEDITKVVSDYAKASGTRWVIDPQVRGRIAIVNPGKVSLADAFDQLATALAINGYAYTEDGGSYRISQARQIQRSNIPVVKEVPPLRPERMMTWVATLRNVSAEEMMREVRTMSSKDGEMVALTSTNQMVFTDFSSTLNRISKVIAELDQPIDAQRAKIVASGKAARAVKEASQARFRSEK
jgi:type II secretory pathway component GspD/PulD (secretin)